MNFLSFTNAVKNLWDSWNIKAVVLLSLTLQVILILLAPLRKRTINRISILFIWVSYLLADWAASFAVGHISNGSKDSINPCDKEKFVSSVGHYFFSSGKAEVTSCGGDKQRDALSSSNNIDLLAFWAPFLLVHLGGPDTITAFALEDNELWRRHFFSLIVQLAATVYVFWLTLPKNKLWIPTLLMFGAGIIKYLERTFALFLASLNRFRESMLKEPDPGPNYAKLMEEYSSKKEAGLPTKIEMTREPGKESMLAANVREPGKLKEIEVVTYAYHYFQKFKGLIVDIIFSYRERNESRDFFLNRNAEDALKLIELELNFIYEAFYTKVLVVHSLTGYIFRLISIVLILVAYGLFYSLDKHDFKKFDIIVTYTLLFGAISLDGIALIMLISSDWTIAAINTNKTLANYVPKFVESYLFFKSLRWCVDSDKVEVLDTPPILRRWSESVSGFNLIAYCLEQRPHADRGCFRRFMDKMDYFGVWDNVTDFFFPKTSLYPTKKLPKNLWSSIFDELKEKSKDAADDAETTKRICSARGAYTIQEQFRDVHKITGDYIQNIAYDESLLLWHVATDLCFWKETHQTRKETKKETVLCFWKETHKTQGIDALDKEGDNSYWSWRFVTKLSCWLWRAATKLILRERPGKAKTDPTKENRHFSKLLSDYMIYLLVKQPNMMSAVTGIGQIRYRDTCAEAVKFFSRRGIKQDQRKACQAILAVDTEVKPVYVKGDRSKSVLFDASMLAKELEKLDEHERWQIIIKVWVEMLSYAASHCRPDTHAKEVSKGGQLISFVWLLMAHFGLGEQFQINEGHTRAKLIVDK